MRTIGIDIGTTTISAVVLEAETGRLLESRTVENGCFIDTGHSWERIQDADRIVLRAKTLLEEMLEHFPDAEAVGLTGQMHGILYMDKEGKAVSPLYTWQDQRSALPSFSVVDYVRRTCGLSVPAGYGLATHLALLREGQIPRGAASVCTIPDYFGMVLTRRKRPLMHRSMAASLGFFDAEKGSFETEALESLGLGFDPAILPEVMGREKISVTCRGESTGETGDGSLQPGTWRGESTDGTGDGSLLLGTWCGKRVTAALGDNQASFLAAVGFRPDTVLLNVGTGSQISVLSERYFTAPGIEARPYIGDRYLLVGASLCGGRAYAILERFFRAYAAELGMDEPQYSVMERLAQKAPDPDPMHVTTTFNGTRADPAVRGGIRNLTENNFTPQGLVRGVMQGMADELFEMFRTIQEGAGVRAAALVGSGNGLRKNAPLQKIFERTFGAKLTLSPYQEEAACGAAYCPCIFSFSSLR